MSCQIRNLITILNKDEANQFLQFIQRMIDASDDVINKMLFNIGNLNIKNPKLKILFEKIKIFLKEKNNKNKILLSLKNNDIKEIINKIGKKLFFITLIFFNMSLDVKGIKIIHTINHLKKFSVKGGTS
jgi:hypothetical protein